MTAQLLIYETVIPLSAARHRGCGIETARNYGFSSKTNSVPLMAVEFPNAASEYAIVFAGTKDNVMPAVILGVRDSENLFLSRDAKWDAQYIPAFVRRYPFVFSTSADGERFVLCVDEDYSGFNREGRGQKLFDDDSKPTQFVQNILTFLQEYQAQFNRTQAFCRKVRELDLLEPMQAQVEMASGEKLSLAGFMAVSREKLKALPGDKLAELAKTDELELLYLHLQSMRNFQNLPSRLAVVRGGAGSEASDTGESDRQNETRASA
ncbi:SapC family protein [Bradyrhizobium sp. GCM10027634]|uniref:SapC family protein n=1 Tax=unclassified Bradyrhizobium TaxID=2631580 RepID=UPI00263B4667|nr:SapC family protein [Bradyrhizobium sp. WYCCWR 12677]MDN5005288.1 SapC family protein [Bradyrhizobium sp. WYCCWR 12677]